MSSNAVQFLEGLLDTVQVNRKRMEAARNAGPVAVAVVAESPTEDIVTSGTSAKDETDFSEVSPAEIPVPIPENVDAEISEVSPAEIPVPVPKNNETDFSSVTPDPPEIPEPIDDESSFASVAPPPKVASSVEDAVAQQVSMQSAAANKSFEGVVTASGEVLNVEAAPEELSWTIADVLNRAWKLGQ